MVNKNSKCLAMIHWIFNAWGEKYEELMKDTYVPDQMNKYLKLPVFEPGIVMEGGSIEVNGRHGHGHRAVSVEQEQEPNPSNNNRAT